MNYLTLDLDDGDLVLSDNSVWKSLNTWLGGGTLYSDYYDASNCGDYWSADVHRINIDSNSTYLTFTIEYEFINATATDSCLCQIKFDEISDGVAVTADASGLNVLNATISKHVDCNYSNANIKIDITVNLLTKEITTYIHKDNVPLAKTVSSSNYSFTKFLIQAGSRGDDVYRLPTTTKLLNVSVSDDAISYNNFSEILNYIDKRGLAKIWTNTKSYIASQLLGKSNTGHTHSKSDLTNLFDTVNTWTAQNSFNSDLNLNYASTDVDDIVNSVAGSATLDNFVHMTGNETVNGIKSFPDGIVANVTGSATSATNDGSGNVISTTYGKLGAVNEWTGNNDFSSLSVNGTQVTPSLYPYKIVSTSNGGTPEYLNLADEDHIATGFNGVTQAGLYKVRFNYEVPGSPTLSSTSYSDGILIVFASGTTSSVSSNSRHLQIFIGNYHTPSWVTRLGTRAAGTTNWTWENWAYITNNKRSYSWEKVQHFIGEYLGNEYTSNYYTNFGIYGKRDTYGQSGMFITKYRPAVNQGEMTTSDAVQLGIDALENSVRTNNVFDIKTKGYDSETGKFTVCDVVTALEGNLGTTDRPWKTFNGLNPGVLSLPDYNSSAKLDISGSITPSSSGNIYYTPTINGWLYVCFNISSATTSDSFFYIQAKDSAVANSSFVQTSWILTSVGVVNLAIFFPVIANKQYIMQINFTNYTITKAHVIPCLGNV